MIKDILALANGSATTAGETAYLIIGADDTQGWDGMRTLMPCAAPTPSRRQLLDWVNAACEPRLEDVHCESVAVDGARLLVLTIPPSPYLHETTRVLDAGGKRYTEYSVFMRLDDQVRVASARERVVLATMKQHAARESQRIAPQFVGAVTGATAVGTALATTAQQHTLPGGSLVAGITGVIIGGVVGGLVGNVLHMLQRFHSDVARIPQPWRTFAWPLLIVITGVCQVLIQRFVQYLQRHFPPEHGTR